MFKEQLKKDIDKISPSPELLDRVSLMMSEETLKPRRNPYITVLRYAGAAAAVFLLTFGAVRLGLSDRRDDIKVEGAPVTAAEAPAVTTAAAVSETYAAGAAETEDEQRYTDGDGDIAGAGEQPAGFALIPQEQDEEVGEDSGDTETNEPTAVPAAPDDTSDSGAPDTVAASSVAADNNTSEDTADRSPAETEKAPPAATTGPDQDPEITVIEVAIDPTQDPDGDWVIGGAPSGALIDRDPENYFIEKYPAEAEITGDIDVYYRDRPAYSFEEAAERIAANDALSLRRVVIREALPGAETGLNFANGCTIFSALVIDVATGENEIRNVIFAGTESSQECGDPVYRRFDELLCETEIIDGEMIIRDYPRFDIYNTPAGKAAYLRINPMEIAGLKKYAADGLEMVTTTQCNPARYYGIFDYTGLTRAFISEIETARERLNAAVSAPETWIGTDNEELPAWTEGNSYSGNLYVFRDGEKLTDECINGETTRLAELCAQSAAFDSGMQLKMLLSDDDIDAFMHSGIYVSWSSGSEIFLILIGSENSFMVYFDHENNQRVFALPESVKAEVMEILG